MADEPLNDLDATTVELIKAQEGWRSTDYKDARGRSIGYGHYIKSGEEHLLGATLSKEQGEELLYKDIRSHQQPWLSQITRKMKPTQLAALTSFAYNVGPKALASLVPYINNGDYETAFNTMRKYRMSEGQINPVLVKRRELEIDLFQADLADSDGAPAPFLRTARAANKWQSQKGVLERVKEKFTGKVKTYETASFDTDFQKSQDDQTLSGLKALASQLNAGMPNSIDEKTWAARVIEEGRGW